MDSTETYHTFVKRYKETRVKEKNKVRFKEEEGSLVFRELSKIDGLLISVTKKLVLFHNQKCLNARKFNKELFFEIENLRNEFNQRILSAQKLIDSSMSNKNLQMKEHFQIILAELSRRFSADIQFPSEEKDSLLSSERFTVSEKLYYSKYAVDLLPSAIIDEIEQEKELSNRIPTTTTNNSLLAITESENKTRNELLSRKPKSIPLSSPPKQTSSFSSSPSFPIRRNQNESTQNVTHTNHAIANNDEVFFDNTVLEDMKTENHILTQKFVKNEDKILGIHHQLLNIRETRKQVTMYIAEQAEMVESLYDNAEKSQQNIVQGNLIISEQNAKKGLRFDEKIAVLICILGLLMLVLHWAHP